MTKHQSALVRAFAHCALILVVCLGSISAAIAAGPAGPAVVQDPHAPKIWLGESHPLSVTHVGPAAASMVAGSAQPLAMAAADADEDGVQDLFVGYNTPAGGVVVWHRGNLDAFAPQSDESFQAIGRGEFPAPFLQEAQTLNVPVTPDFIGAGHFTSSGHMDLVVASRGGNSLYVLAGDGKGNFATPQPLSLPGTITTLAPGDLGNSAEFTRLIVGVKNDPGFSLLVLSGTGQGLKPLASYPLAAAAANVNFGEFEAGRSDAAFLSGGEVFILRSSTMQLVKVSLPVSAVAMALGSFVEDRNLGLQMALLAADGSVQIVAHKEFDPRPLSFDELKAIRHAVKLPTMPNPLVPVKTFPANGWKIVEGFPSLANVGAGQPVFFRTRISSNGADDVMWLSASSGQMVLISHPDVQPGASTFLPGQVSVRSYYGKPVAALPMRINVDGRPGVMALHQGEAVPSVLMPLPDPTFTVNVFTDSVDANPGDGICADGLGNCSLRAAIMEANATAGTDTIMLPAGTYTLTIPRNAADHHTSLTGTLEVTDSVNIIGAGQNTTIIQGGTNLTNSVDKVFSFNQDIDLFTNATVSISNLTIQNGHNRGDCCITQDGFGGAFDFDTGLSGNNTLTVTNVTLQNNAIFDGQGGGFTIFNTKNGSGSATFSNVTIQNNTGTPNASGCCGDGGGGVIDARSHMTMTNVTISGNHAGSNAGTNANGGGLFLQGQHTQPQSHISGGTIVGNTAAGTGGGIDTIATLLIDGGATIVNNTAGKGGANGFGGGGIINDSNDGLTLNNVTITGNTTTGNGGGIFTGDCTADIPPSIGVPVTMHFSRLTGNTSSLTPGSSNLFNLHGTVTVTNNWWGTNNPSSTIVTSNTSGTAGCTGSSGTVTFDPFIVLTHTASPNKIRINQSTTLTGDMSKDNHGSGAALAGNLGVIIGLPITFGNAVLGSIPGAPLTENLDTNAQATATFNAGGGGGAGSADATVDQQTVTAPIIILQPPSITKSFSPTTVAINAPSTVTFTIDNSVNTVAINASFVDTLPANLVVATVPNVVNNCGGTVTAPASATHIDFSNAALAVGSCTIKVDVESAVDQHYNNSVQILSTDAGDGNTASANLTVINPPHMVKAFGAATIPLNGTTSLTFTIDSNSNQNLTLNGVTFTDSLPVGLVVATPGNPSTTCANSAVAAADGSSSVVLSGADVAANTSCTVSVTVQGTTAGVKSNSVQVSSSNGGTGNTANATITVVPPPTIIKAFGAGSIPLNGSTSLQFTVQNNSTTVGLTGVAFNDTLPAGLVISTPSGLTGSCGAGTVTATQNTNVISLSGGAIAANGSCMFTVNVTGTAAGQQNNTTGNVTSTEGGTGGTASASLAVVAPPSIAKVFNPSNIALNATTALQFTITNPPANTVAAAGVAFTDTLPTGLTVANSTSTVCGGTLTTTAPTGIALSGATIAVNSNCQFSVTVTGAASGNYNNTTGAVTSTNGGTGNTASANLSVAGPPTIIKAFGVALIPLGATTSLTFTINNPNNLTLTGVAFTDSLPAGLVVANGSATTCGGTLTLTAPASIALSGATIGANSQCQFSVTVTGTTLGVKNNTTGKVTSTEGGTGTTSNTATITVVAPPVILKTFAQPTPFLAVGGTTTLTFTITNPMGNISLTGIGFTDTLPTGIVVSTPNGLSGNTCTTMPTATAGSGSISLAGASLAGNTSCTFTLNVTSTAPGSLVNSVTVTSNEGGTGNTSVATLEVGPQPTFTKAFSSGGNPATSIPLNTNATLTFTIVNPVANATTLSSLAFTDTLPAGLQIANTPNLTTTCTTVAGDVSVAGTVTAAANTTIISLSGLSLVGGTTGCTIAVDVTGIAAGTHNNSVTISSTEGGNPGPQATASIDVVAPPSIAKVFNPTAIALNGTTALTFTITNPLANAVAENGVAFTDTLPVGLTVANSTSTACGGTLTLNGSTGIALSGATIAVNSNCQFSVTVTGAAAGSYTNTAGPVTSTNGGTGNTASASLTVDAPPTISKAFGAATVPLNGTTSLTFNLANSNSTSLTGVSFSDSLPAGLVVASVPNLTNSCGGTPTATGGSGSVSLSGVTLAGSGTCTLSLNVQGTTDGVKVNTVTITSNETGPGTPGTASITVVGPPTIAKAFNASSIPLGGTTTLVFTLSTPNLTVDLTGVAFSDTLPSTTGTLVVAATPNVVNTCSPAGTVTATPGAGIISLSGAGVIHNTSCIVSVDVTGTAAGDAANTTGAITSTEGGTGTASNTVTVKVVAPPTIQKAFGAASIALNAPITLTFTITNPPANTTGETGIAFSDTLSGGLQVAAPSGGVSNTCGGTVTAAAGGTSISLTSGSIATPGTTCTVVVNVTGTVAGNNIPNTTGAVSSTNGGTGATSNTATLTVVGQPVFSKAFGAASIPLNGSTSLTFNIQNPNTTTALSGVAFSDTLPAGLIISTPNGQAGSCGAGTITATQGTNVISLSGGTIAANGSCTFSVNVTGTAAGNQNNITGNVTSTEGGTGGMATASITVVAPPAITKGFADTSIAPTASTSLSFTITNTNSSQGLTGIAFTDTLPAGLVVSTPNGLAGSCGAGTITATAGSNSVGLTGGTVAAAGSCTFSVKVTGTTSGTKNNTTGNVTSTEGGTGGTASASLFVLTPPVIAKAFNPTGISVNGVSTLTITITDPAANGGVALAGVAFTDNFPVGLTVATPNNLINNCGGTATATAGSAQLALVGGSVPANSSCTVVVNVTSSAAGLYTNTTGPVSSTNAATGNSATATLNVALPPTVIKSFSADTVALNGTVFVNLNINNPNASTLTGITLPDNLPAGLVVATPNGASTDCGGTLTAVPGSGSFTLTGGTLAGGASCNVFVNVKDTTPGDKFNTAGPISSTESGQGLFSNTVGVSVTLPPTVSKVFGAAGIPILSTTSLTFNIANPNSGTEMVNIGLTDLLPAGLVVATPNGATGTCITSNGAAVIANPGSQNITLLALTLLANASCSFSVNVTGTHRGHWVNTTGNVTAVFDAGGGNFFAITGGTATAAIDVLAANLTVTKTHSGNFAQRQIGATYTITVGNNGTAPTVGTVTLVDTLPSFLTATAITGANWACDLPSLTCTRSDVLGIGGSYDPITVTVNVAPNTPATVTNMATAMGGGDLSNEVASDPTNVTVTGPPIVITPDPNSNTIVVAAGMAAKFTFTVDAGQINPPPEVVTFTCSGLPRGAECVFSPLTEAQPVTQVAMTVITLGRNDSGALLPFGGDRTPIYAVLLPVLGLVGISLVGRGRKTRLRLAAAIIGLAVILALWGCGGNPLVTPPGTYPITMTGTTTTPSGTVSGTATVTLRVL